MRTRLEKHKSIDPVAWRIWSEALVRVNNSAELARGLEMQRRLHRTTLADHETRLKLVLAGNQVRDAAAGTRQVPPGGFVQQGQGSTA